jgi:hypothetical protein
MINVATGNSTVFAEIATKMAPVDAPIWLPRLLRDWAPSIMLSCGVHAKQPTKAAMREHLRRMSEVAALLQKALQDTAIKEFLELEGNIRIENIGSLDHTLRTLAERAAVASASPRIATTSARAKRGAGKALPANALSPKCFCALIISEVWKYLHGGYPAPGNRKAASAADAYWRAWGGMTRSWGSDRLTSWSYHFKTAMSPAADDLRKEVHRHCVEHAHQTQLLKAG